MSTLNIRGISSKHHDNASSSDQAMSTRPRTDIRGSYFPHDTRSPYRAKKNQSTDSLTQAMSATKSTSKGAVGQLISEPSAAVVMLKGLVTSPI